LSGLHLIHFTSEPTLAYKGRALKTQCP